MRITLTPVTGPRARTAPRSMASVLLVGPYDPSGGEYTFLAPPLGVWRLAGVLRAAGARAEVFDPNCGDGDPAAALASMLRTGAWDIVGISTTGMTLRHDLSLAHVVKRVAPTTLLVAGGMEATFDPQTVLSLGSVDLVVLGEGERPLLELCQRLATGQPIVDVPGTAWLTEQGVARRSRPALTRDELRDAILHTPYADMPYARYWNRLEQRYAIGALPIKAAREARLTEIRSVRLNTLNYCPMNCTFCSSTNFLHEAQGGTTAKVGRLDADECVTMLERIVAAQPAVRTIIFQDDIFVFRQDARVLPLCEAIVDAKRLGRLPFDLRFMSTNRIDAMTPERLAAMKAAGFRVLGFGIESFAPDILKEFNKAQIVPFIEPMLREALRLGFTPFLDLILTSPRCRLDDLANNVANAFAWIEAGCEVGMYPYVIPFSGAAMARDISLRPHTTTERRTIAGTALGWDQPAKILPIDATVRQSILAIEDAFERRLAALAAGGSHLPSRVRSLLWIESAVPLLRRAGYAMPSDLRIRRSLAGHLVEDERPPVSRHARSVRLGTGADRLRSVPCPALS
jgi:radical SAM superfamily enzyme YgiQ (UPF0313 family)